MRSIESFLTFKEEKKKDLLQLTVGNKVSVLVTLTLYENLFIAQEKSVSCPH